MLWSGCTVVVVGNPGRVSFSVTCWAQAGPFVSFLHFSEEVTHEKQRVLPSPVWFRVEEVLGKRAACWHLLSAQRS